MVRRAFCLLLLASPMIASADTVTVTNTTTRHEGDYGGVVPGQSERSTAARPKFKVRPHQGTLSWVGFEAKDGGAELFFQSAAAFNVEQYVDGTTLVVHLSLPHMGANAWRVLDTRYFDNPLAGAKARTVSAARATKSRPARTRGIEVRITFKNPKDVHEGTLRTATEPDGLYYAYLSFPEGADPGTSAATPSTFAEPER